MTLIASWCVITFLIIGDCVLCWPCEANTKAGLVCGGVAGVDAKVLPCLYGTFAG